MKEQIIDLVTGILSVGEGVVTENTLIDDLEEWDSLASVMIIGEIEARLGVSIDLDDAMEVTGVKDLITLCEK